MPTGVSNGKKSSKLKKSENKRRSLGPRGQSQSCHQCRQSIFSSKGVCESRTGKDRLKCSTCTRFWCEQCLENRYSIHKAKVDTNWKCPFCSGQCNCSVCRRKEGKLATGVLSPLVRNAGYSSVSEFLDKGTDEVAKCLHWKVATPLAASRGSPLKPLQNHGGNNNVCFKKSMQLSVEKLNPSMLVRGAPSDGQQGVKRKCLHHTLYSISIEEDDDGVVDAPDVKFRKHSGMASDNIVDTNLPKVNADTTSNAGPSKMANVMAKANDASLEREATREREASLEGCGLSGSLRDSTSPSTSECQPVVDKRKYEDFPSSVKGDSVTQPQLHTMLVGLGGPQNAGSVGSTRNHCVALEHFGATESTASDFTPSSIGCTALQNGETAKGEASCVPKALCEARLVSSQELKPTFMSSNPVDVPEPVTVSKESVKVPIKREEREKAKLMAKVEKEKAKLKMKERLKEERQKVRLKLREEKRLKKLKDKEIANEKKREERQKEKEEKERKEDLQKQLKELKQKRKKELEDAVTLPLVWTGEEDREVTSLEDDSVQRCLECGIPDLPPLCPLDIGLPWDAVTRFLFVCEFLHMFGPVLKLRRAVNLNRLQALLLNERGLNDIYQCLLHAVLDPANHATECPSSSHVTDHPSPSHLISQSSVNQSLIDRKQPSDVEKLVAEYLHASGRNGFIATGSDGPTLDQSLVMLEHLCTEALNSKVISNHIQCCAAKVEELKRKKRLSLKEKTGDFSKELKRLCDEGGVKEELREKRDQFTEKLKNLTRKLDCERLKNTLFLRNPPLGIDRYNRVYWKLQCCEGLLVEVVPSPSELLSSQSEVKWAIIESRDEVKEFITCLHPRGKREKTLMEKIKDAVGIHDNHLILKKATA